MKKLIIIFSTVVLVSGCMVGPKFRKDEWKTEDAYRFSPDSASSNSTAVDTTQPDTLITLKWWEVYNDTVLQTLIDTALANNRDMQIAASRIIEAQYMVGYKKADIYPAFDYHGSASVINKTNVESAESGTLLRDNISGFGMMSWELDFWGKFRHATQAAKAQLVASEESKKLLTTSLVSEVASLYFELRSLDQQLEIAQRTMVLRKESTWIITQRFLGGEVAELDKFQAQSQEAITAALIPSLERQIAQTEHAISVLIGKNPGYISRGLDNASQVLPVSIPVGLPSDLLALRPDVKQAEQQWIAQNNQIGVAQALRYPSISLTGVLGAASQDLSNITHSGSIISYAVGSVSGPIFYFGKNKRRVQMEEEKTVQARLNYEKTVLKAFAEVENALMSIDTYRREYEARHQQAQASGGAAVLSRERYYAGYTNYLEMLDNDRTELDAQLLAAQALQQHLKSTVDLYKALGGGWEPR